MSRKAVLITGAARRVGKALALHLAENGYDIALHYHTSEEEAKAVQTEVRALGVACELFRQDLCALEELPALMEKVASVFPHCHALINCASVFEQRRFLDSGISFYQRMMRINLEAPVFLTQAFARTQKQGQVVNILDTEITEYKHSHFFYLLAKKALREFTQMATVELGPHIKVNAVCPGIVLPLGDRWNEAYMENHAKTLPLAKTATPQDVCNTVEWLLKSESVTGQLIYVDGGEHLL